MSLTAGGGRLGNQIIRNLALHLIAEKNNLSVNYSSKDLINNLGIDLFSGSNIHKEIKELNDNNFFELYNCKNINYNLNAGGNYFQTKDIINVIYDYLNTEKIKQNIIKNNPFKKLYNTNNDLLIHIRLTDTAQWNPGVSYYLNTVKSINFDNLHITTDDKEHDIIKSLIEKYPSAKLVDYDEILTIQYASTFKHIILSHGSFSAVIGYLSFFSDIYYPEYESHKMWYGDMFSIKNWNKMSVL